MPKIGAAITDISTEYVLPMPDTYIFEVTEIDAESQEGKNKAGQTIRRDTQIIRSKIVAKGDGTPTEEANKAVRDYINLHTTEGEWNEISLGNIKRYMNACLGEGNYDSDDPDTDLLKGRQFKADLYHDAYTPKGSPPGTAAKINAKIKPASIVSI